MQMEVEVLMGQNGAERSVAIIPPREQGASTASWKKGNFFRHRGVLQFGTHALSLCAAKASHDQGRKGRNG